MQRLTLVLVSASLILTPWTASAAFAAPPDPGCAPGMSFCPPPPPASCVGNTCNVRATNPPGTTPPSNGSGGGSTSQCTDVNGAVVDCYDPLLGWYSQSDHCYYKPENPPPPPTDPSWQGHYPSGAVYLQTCPGTGTFGGGSVWLASPPQGATPTPAQLAQQALSTLHVPDPVMRRSPTETNSDHGTPYTWVNLWTWFWADPASWKVQTARATAGPVWAEVTVTPTQLIIFPGETGTASVTCSGPGRPWTEADGDSAPSGGGCGVVYRHVSAVPITATVAVEWAVTWRGSGGVSGTLPGMRTQSSSAFVVEQIQVVTR